MAMLSTTSPSSPSLEGVRRVDHSHRKPINVRKSRVPSKPPISRCLPEHDELAALRAASRRFTLPFTINTKVSLRRLPKDHTGDPFLDLGFLPYDTPEIRSASKEQRHRSAAEKIPTEETLVPAFSPLAHDSGKEVHSPIISPQLTVQTVDWSPSPISPALDSAVSLVSSSRPRSTYLNHLESGLFESSTELPAVVPELPAHGKDVAPRQKANRKSLRLITALRGTSFYDPKAAELALSAPPLPRRRSFGGLQELAKKPFGRKPPSAAADVERQVVELQAEPVPERRMFPPRRDRSPSLRGLERGLRRSKSTSKLSRECFAAIPIPPIPQDRPEDDLDDAASCYTKRTSAGSMTVAHVERSSSKTGSTQFGVSSPVAAGVFEGVPYGTSGDSSGETTPEDDDVETPGARSPDVVLVRDLSPHEYFDRSNNGSPLESDPMLSAKGKPSLFQNLKIRTSMVGNQSSMTGSLQKPLPAPPADLLPAPLNTSPKQSRDRLSPHSSPMGRVSPAAGRRKNSRPDLEALDQAFSLRNPALAATADAIANVQKELDTISEDDAKHGRIASPLSEIMQISRGPGSMHPSRAAPRPPVMISVAKLQMQRNGSRRSVSHIAGQVRRVSVVGSVHSQKRSSSVGSSVHNQHTGTEGSRSESPAESFVEKSSIGIRVERASGSSPAPMTPSSESTEALCDRGAFLALDCESLDSRQSLVSTRPQSLIGSCFGEGQRDKEIQAEQAEVIVLNILRRVESLSDLFSLATVSKGFYITYKKHELSLMRGALHKMSAPAWELREVSAPGENWAAVSGIEATDDSSEYTPSSYLRAFTADLYAMVALKTLMLTRCKNLLRPETIEALSGRNADRAKQLDSAWWRCWTFCRVFGSNKHREDDLTGQLDWLKGGRRCHQEAVSASCFMDVLGSTQDLTMNSVLLNPPPNFGRGNGSGLNNTDLADMSEVWGCLTALLDGLRGKSDLARRHGIFSESTIKRTGLSPNMLLEEWLAHIMTLGPQAVLLLCAPTASLPPNAPTPATANVEAFAAAKRHGLNKWKPPATPGLLRSFMREAIKRASDDLQPSSGGPRGWTSQARGKKCLEAIYEMDDTSCTSPVMPSRASSMTPNSAFRSDTPLSAVSSLHTLPMAQRSFGALSSVSAMDSYIGSRVDMSPVSPMQSRERLGSSGSGNSPPRSHPGHYLGYTGGSGSGSGIGSSSSIGNSYRPAPQRANSGRRVVSKIMSTAWQTDRERRSHTASVY